MWGIMILNFKMLKYEPRAAFREGRGGGEAGDQGGSGRSRSAGGSRTAASQPREKWSECEEEAPNPTPAPLRLLRRIQ